MLLWEPLQGQPGPSASTLRAGGLLMPLHPCGLGVVAGPGPGGDWGEGTVGNHEEMQAASGFNSAQCWAEAGSGRLGAPRPPAAPHPTPHRREGLTRGFYCKLLLSSLLLLLFAGSQRWNRPEVVRGLDICCVSRLGAALRIIV